MGSLMFNMKMVWCNEFHSMAMVHTDEVNFIGEQKETMLLDRGRYIPVEHLIKTESNEIYVNEDGQVIWRDCGFNNILIEQAKRILKELSTDGYFHLYMPERCMAMAIVSDTFTIFIAPRTLASNLDMPMALKPPISSSDYDLISEGSE